MSTPEEAKAVIARAADGLLYPSESDEPFEAFAWPAAANETAERAVSRHGGGRPLTVQPIDAFFGDLAGTDDADRYDALRGTLERELTGLTVVRAGRVRVGVYVLGRCGGTWVGLKTVSIET